MSSTDAVISLIASMIGFVVLFFVAYFFGKDNEMLRKIVSMMLGLVAFIILISIIGLII